MKKDQNFSGVLPPPRFCHEPVAELTAPQDTHLHFTTLQKLNLCSERDISKTAWTNACTEYY